MKRSLLVLLLIVAAAGAAWFIVVIRETQEPGRRPENETAAREHASESQQALRRAAEFLQPDTKSDIRFGKPKSHGQPTPASPSPR